jgi:phosphoglucosamine mutase
MRLQGTDGVRGVVKKTLDLKSPGSPIQLYLESGILTGEFFEAYCFGLARYLIKSGKVGPGGEIAIGWDPRDIGGECTGKAVTGIRKAGLNARVLGVVPTPLVPLFMAAWGLQAGIAITASHNPADQNGIKIFLTPLGLKPLPEEEEEISGLIIALDPANLKAAKETGKSVDSSEEARRLALEFHADPCNSWLPEGRFLPPLRLLVDASNGACSGIAVKIFRAAGFREVHEYNLRPEEGINENCGVVGFENCSSIKADSLGALCKNSLVTAMFEMGRIERSTPAGERKTCMGVVFDGDGDRFHLLVYNPKGDEIHVLSGDEAAIHQALYLMESDPGQWNGALYVNTVESDIQCSLEASKAGLALEKTGVGDKWLLRKAAESPERFAVGSERSGHLITVGCLTNYKNEKISVFIGNGIKGALNTLASIFFLHPRPEEEGWLEKVVRPFPAGFNKILYAYYTDKAKWRRDSEAWKKAQALVGERIAECFGGRVLLREKPFLEESDLLYFEIMDLRGRLKASLHIRNSGTEDKTGITIKGCKEDSVLLSRLGKEVLKLLVSEIKNPGHHFCKAQNRLISLLYPGNAMAREDLPVDLLESGSLDRLLREVGEKEGMLESSAGGYRLSEFGKWYFQYIIPL